MGVYILLDRSKSMEDRNLWSEALGSINGYVANLPGWTEITMAVFDSVGYDIIRKNSLASVWIPVSNADATPRGGTPLLDSAARMIWRMFDDNAERSILVIMTDGEENQSQYFKKYDVTSLINAVQAKGWEVVFLGANFDKVSEQAAGLGLARSKSLNMTQDNMSFYSRGMVADKSTSYLSTGAAMAFSADEQAEAVSPVAKSMQLRNDKRAG